jgi:hypothetical protein
MAVSQRLHFAVRYALRHLFFSLVIALASAAVVFGLWYPTPYRQMLDVGHIYLLVLAVDVVCGPLLTLVLASPRKLRRELAGFFTHWPDSGCRPSLRHAQRVGGAAGGAGVRGRSAGGGDGQ